MATRRHPLLVSFSLTLLLTVAALVGLPAQAHAADSGGIQAMYRLYNTTTREHFYTASTKERDVLKGKGWRDEGIGWYAPVKSSTPVYRLYNARLKDHHYTTSKKEHDALVKGGSWKSEGIGFYSCDEKDFPLYREFHPTIKSGSHNYTTDANEHKVLTKGAWKDEGIGWYGCLPGSQADWFSVSFDKNGGSGSMHIQGIMRGKATALDANKFSRSGYTFTGWNTKKDGSGTSYKNKASVKNLVANHKNITLYAQWKKNATKPTPVAVTTYTIAFDANGGTGTMPEQTAKRDTNVKLKANGFKRSNWVFAGWNDKADGTGKSYKNKASIKNLAAKNQTITLYAQWQLGEYTIHFDPNASPADYSYTMQDQVVTTGARVALTSNKFSRYNYSFTGWNTKKDGSGTHYDDAQEVINLAQAGKTIVLYAQWSTIFGTIIFDPNVAYMPEIFKKTHPNVAQKTYQLQFKDATSSRALEYGSTFNYQHSGYALFSFNTKADGTGKSYGTSISSFKASDLGPDHTLKLYAQWGQNYVYATFNKNDSKATGSWAEYRCERRYSGIGYPTPYSVEMDFSTVTNPLTFKIDGKTVTASARLLGFTTTKDGSGAYFYPVPSNSKDSVKWTALPNTDANAKNTLYAQWEKNVMLMRLYNSLGSSSYMDKTYIVGAPGRGQTFNGTTTNSITGYVHIGWTKSTTDTVNIVKTPAAITENSKAGSAVKLYAVWEPRFIKLTMSYNGGSMGSSSARSSTANITMTGGTLTSDVPTRTGYTFTGWKDNKSGTVFKSGASITQAQITKWGFSANRIVSTTTAGNNAQPLEVTLTAQWKQNASAAPAQPQMAPAAPSQDLPQQDDAVLQDDVVVPQQDDAVLQDDVVVPEVVPDTQIDETTTNPVALLYQSSDAEPIHIELGEVDTLVLPVPPEREGFRFIGWCTREAGLPQDLTDEELAAAQSDTGLLLSNEDVVLRFIGAEQQRVDYASLPHSSEDLCLYAVWEPSDS